MPSVGPELPPHLLKRKRPAEDDTEGTNSPPHKVQAASAPEKRILGPALPPTANPDELDVDNSSEDDYGPSIPSAKVSGSSLPSARTVGPTLPPTEDARARVAGPPVPPLNPDALDIDSDSEDYGPSISKNTKAPKLSGPSPKKRILGPAPPPAKYLSQRPSHPANDSDSSDDSDYGPALPPPPGSAAEAAQQYVLEQERKDLATAEATPAKPQRDEWMLLPPSDSDWGSRVDPTKLKNRKFASGKGSKAPAEKGGGISSIWTETPQEKRKRLEDEVLGRSEKAVNPSSSSSKPVVESREDQETARRIREYNERNRGTSLLTQRQKDGGQKEADDDPSKREFDREKDMALGGSVGHVAKRDMLAKAADFGSRFQKGRYL